jgi:hypothetical protein
MNIRKYGERHPYQMFAAAWLGGLAVSATLAFSVITVLRHS